MRLIFVISIAFVAAVQTDQSPIDRLPMNQVQVLGSHNSYKQAIDPALLKLLRRDDPNRYASLEYAHSTLKEQLDLGLRKLEIDVVHDPQGGLYARPAGLEMLRKAGVPAGPPYDPEGRMMQPGLKVLHVPDIDFRSQMYTFREALIQLQEWSNAHPRHLPIAITMNAKDGVAEVPDGVQPLSFDGAAFDAWDKEIRETLPPNKLLTPDDVRGDFPTLEEAVLAHAWPPLGKARGRFLFVLDETGRKLETYVAGHPSLKGRVMFVNAREGSPEAAFRIVNDPIASFHYIQRLVRDGYIVRTRSDAETREARLNDYTRLHAASKSGAQFISTDYYLPNPDFGTGFQVRLPGGVTARWNPVLIPPLENLSPPE